MTQPIGLYAHIPFCKAKCHYCDFASGPGSQSDIDRYLELLEREAIREAASAAPVETVFLGGGTPSVLDERQLTRLMRDIVGRFRILPGAEISMEANPESFTEARAEAAALLGVNRVSLGAQSFLPEELKRLGRLHDREAIGRAVAAARAAGIRRVNLDLICGFPGNGREQLRESLERLVALSPEHCSVYIYQLEEESRWGKAGIEPPDEELQIELYYFSKDFLEAAGYEHYEISNFARPGEECRHNLKYWLSQPYLGIGLSAASYLGGVRYVNPSELAEYESAVRSGRPVESALGAEERAREELMLALRLLKGVDQVPGAQARQVLEKHARSGLVARVGEGWALTRHGLTLSNEVFADLI